MSSLCPFYYTRRSSLLHAFVSISGTRGDVDDPLLELRTPTLFILGQLAPLSPLADIEDLREKVKAETFLVLVGGADDQLRMCRQKKKLEGITQVRCSYWLDHGI